MGKQYMISDILQCRQDIAQMIADSDLREVEKSIIKAYLTKAILEVMDFRQDEISCRCA